MGRYTGLTAERGLHLLLREAAAADAEEHAGSRLVDLVRERLPGGRRVEALHRARVLLCRSLLRLLCRRRLQTLLPVCAHPHHHSQYMQQAYSLSREEAQEPFQEHACHTMQELLSSAELAAQAITGCVLLQAQLALLL